MKTDFPPISEGDVIGGAVLIALDAKAAMTAHQKAGPGRWLRWPDFWLPLSAEGARSAVEEAHRLAADGVRVEIACGGGKGRTGTALACIAQLGGVAAERATSWVREHYDARAIETPWQRRYVRRFTRSGTEHF